MNKILETLVDFSGCDEAGLALSERGKYYRCSLTTSPERCFRFETLPLPQNGDKEVACDPGSSLGMIRLCQCVASGHTDRESPFFTEGGSFWTGDTGKAIVSESATAGQPDSEEIHLDGPYRTLALIALAVEEGKTGLLTLMSKQRDYLDREDIEFYEWIAEVLGVALASRRTQLDLRERVKEITCLYGISRLVDPPGANLSHILRGIVDLLPPAWLYPEVASAGIDLDGHCYRTTDFQEEGDRQMAEIIVARRSRGSVSVVYSEERPDLDEGPFLKEERHLIDTVAREIALLLERRQFEEDKAKLEEQLRHADRLATVGQLAAGVAHELNEPLGAILGFAQLARKDPELPDHLGQDIGRIISASLHAREVIRKLMIFARDVPSQKTQVSLNQLVEEGLFFFEGRCAKGGIELVRSLKPDLPDIAANAGQINQILINLMVNAMQAIPEEGRISVETGISEGHVFLAVEDTGVGMSKQIQSQIFLPFFTTKDVDEGTGLGLAVVHGIVTSHGGSIKVESRTGQGTRFEVRLPLTEASSGGKDGADVVQG